MYWLYTVSDKIRVPPTKFSLEKEEAINQILMEKYEGKIDKEMGVIISISNVKNIGEGSIVIGDGAAFYDTTFDILTYNPELHEVFEGNVTELVEFGAFVRMGPLDGLVHVSQIADDFLSYDKQTPSFIGKETNKILKQGDSVRAKIATVSLKQTIQDSKIGLTMRPEGLGKPDWNEKKKTIVKKVKKEKKKE